MTQTTCNQCDAHYNSERELRDHLGTVHRKFSYEQSTSEPSETESGVSAAPVSESVK
jgi:hypothetical protein